MKQTIKNLAITFGKKIWAALVSAVAMLIGETILSLFGKGLTKFRANREARKANPIDVDATVLDDAKSTDDDTVIPADDTDTDNTDVTDNDED